MGEMIDFFDELEKAADKQLENSINLDLASNGLLTGAGIGVDATIEALREMVGELIYDPIEGHAVRQEDGGILVFADPTLKSHFLKRYHIFCRIEDKEGEKGGLL